MAALTAGVRAQESVELPMPLGAQWQPWPQPRVGGATVDEFMTKITVLVEQKSRLQEELWCVERDNARLQRQLEEVRGLVHQPHVLGDSPRKPPRVSRGALGDGGLRFPE